MGARWVQTRIVDKYPAASLRVYAVWLPMLWNDSREKWNGTNMPDSRVMHFWDGDLQLGKWFAKEVNGSDGVAWDIFYLYGPDATWEATPQPLLATGRTIYGEREKLRSEISALLGNE